MLLVLYIFLNINLKKYIIVFHSHHRLDAHLQVTTFDASFRCDPQFIVLNWKDH